MSLFISSTYCLGYFYFIWVRSRSAYFMGWGGVWPCGYSNFKTESLDNNKLPAETERWVDDSMGS